MESNTGKLSYIQLESEWMHQKAIISDMENELGRLSIFMIRNFPEPEDAHGEGIVGRAIELLKVAKESVSDDNRIQKYRRLLLEAVACMKHDHTCSMNNPNKPDESCDCPYDNVVERIAELLE